MKAVLLVNGYARTGKDSFVGYLAAALALRGLKAAAFSSIDPVRDMLGAAGIDTSQKTSEDRDLLAAVGDAVEAHSRFRTNACIRAIQYRLFGEGRDAIFLHAREPALIRGLKREVAERHPAITFLTIKLTRPGVGPSAINASDRDVDLYAYDLTVANDGDLVALAEKAEALIADLLRPDAA